MRRRLFLSNAAMAMAGAAVVGCGKKEATSEGSSDTTKTAVNPTPSQKAYGLQLYTLRDILKDNAKVKDTVRQLVDWGYNEFEAYGYSKGNIFGMTYKEFTDYVKSLGAKVTSAHYDIDVLRTDWTRAVADAQAAGQEYMVLPWIDEPNRTPDGFKKIIEDVNKAAQATKAAGIRMGYHNHDFEFKKVGDKTGFELLLDGLDKDLVSFELDLYWVVRAGQDPEQLFMKYPGRFEQWHVKDMDKTDPSKNADIGTGSIDFKKLFMHAQHVGLKHWYVEQETYPVDPLTSTKNSIDYLKTI
jgi:sugar phosphate isomerase/epimerase